MKTETWKWEETSDESGQPFLELVGYMPNGERRPFLRCSSMEDAPAEDVAAEIAAVPMMLEALKLVSAAFGSSKAYAAAGETESARALWTVNAALRLAGVR